MPVGGCPFMPARRRPSGSHVTAVVGLGPRGNVARQPGGHRLNVSRLNGTVLTACIGLLVVSAAYWAGAKSWPAAIYLLYGGLALMVAALARPLVTSTGSVARRRFAAQALGLLLAAAHLLLSPLRFSGFDELLHVATVRSLQSIGLFGHNPLLPVSAHYPGLEAATSVLQQTMGSSVHVAGVAVVLIARAVLVDALFRLATSLSGSARAGGIAVLTYACSPQFFFFNAQFAYQTLALSLGLFLIAEIFERQDGGSATRWEVIVPVSVALAVTHHVTSWIVFLAVLTGTIGSLLTRSPAFYSAALRRICATLGAAVIVWSSLSAAMLSGYLGPNFREAYRQILGILGGTASSRQLFQSSAGAYSTPAWERVTLLTTVALWCAFIIYAAFNEIRRPRLLTRPLSYGVVAVALTYPLLQLGRLSAAASEIADRASTFVFVAIALLCGAIFADIGGGDRVQASRISGIGHRVGALLTVTILFVGGVILGSGPDWDRLPGPFLISADNRSIDPVTLAAADWARRHLPANSRVLADRTNAATLGAYGNQYPLTDLSEGRSVGQYYFEPNLSNYVLTFLRQHRVEDIILDYRLTGGPPHVDNYIDPGEAPVPTRLTSADLDKFRQLPGARIVYDNQGVVILDTRGFLGAPVIEASGSAPQSDGLSWPLRFLLTTVSSAFLLWRCARTSAARPQIPDLARLVSHLIVAGLVLFGLQAPSWVICLAGCALVAASPTRQVYLQRSLGRPALVLSIIVSLLAVATAVTAAHLGVAA